MILCAPAFNPNPNQKKQDMKNQNETQTETRLDKWGEIDFRFYLATWHRVEKKEQARLLRLMSEKQRIGIQFRNR
jgi:hypothetical protein